MSYIIKQMVKEPDSSTPSAKSELVTKYMTLVDSGVAITVKRDTEVGAGATGPFYDSGVKTFMQKGVNYYFHPRINQVTGEPYDLCVIPFGDIIPALEAQSNTPLYYKSFREEHLMTNTNKSTLDSIEDIIMVGYSCGIWDKVNNRPIIRKGITATDPKVDYRNIRSFFQIGRWA